MALHPELKVIDLAKPYPATSKIGIGLGQIEHIIGFESFMGVPLRSLLLDKILVIDKMCQNNLEVINKS